MGKEKNTGFIDNATGWNRVALRDNGFPSRAPSAMATRSKALRVIVENDANKRAGANR